MKPLILWALAANFAAAAPNDPFQPGLDFKSLKTGSAVAGREAKDDERLWIEAIAPDKAAREKLVNLGISIEELRPGSVGGVGLPENLPELTKLGVKFTSKPLNKHFGKMDFPTEDSAFHNYAEAVEEIGKIAALEPKLVSVFSIGKAFSGKRDLLAIRLNTTAKDEALSDKPGILFLGTHHAREHLSTEVPLMLARYLVENRAKPEIAELLATRDVYIVPMVNPDGVEYDLRGNRYNMHRKNIRPNSDGSVGVDLNRNYDANWCGEGASSNPRSDTYCGTSAFSEPETQAVRDFVGKRKNLKILLSYHTFSELILYPYGSKDADVENKEHFKAFRAMATTMAQWTGYKPQKSSDLYVASGDTCDWAYLTHGIFAFTFELTPKSMWEGGFYPGAQAIASTFNANIRPALYLIGLADNPLRAAGSLTLTASGIPTHSGGR
jgi:carboxypeptidase T